MDKDSAGCIIRGAILYAARAAADDMWKNLILKMCGKVMVYYGIFFALFYFFFVLVSCLHSISFSPGFEHVHTHTQQTLFASTLIEYVYCTIKNMERNK